GAADCLRAPFTTPIPNGANGCPVAREGQPAPSANGGNGRDHQGRFTKGNRGGPGNPFARQIAAFRRALCAVVTEGELEKVGRRLLEQAQGGNLVAAKLLLAYTVGRPGEAVDPDTLDLNEWQLYQQGSTRAEEVAGMLERMPPGLSCELVRQLVPFLE